MSAGITCNACGKPAHLAGSVLLEVTVPKKGAKANTCISWSEIDICAICLEKPLIEVLLLACDSFDEVRALAPPSQK